MYILNLDALLNEIFQDIIDTIRLAIKYINYVPNIKHKFVKSLGKIPKIHIKKVHFRPFVPIRFNRKREMFLIEEIVPP